MMSSTLSLSLTVEIVIDIMYIERKKPEDRGEKERWRGREKRRREVRR